MVDFRACGVSKRTEKGSRKAEKGSGVLLRHGCKSGISPVLRWGVGGGEEAGAVLDGVIVSLEARCKVPARYGIRTTSRGESWHQ
jgi:hypothetical protein